MSHHPNRYIRKQRHKRELKRRHAIYAQLYYAKLDEEKCHKEYEEDRQYFKWIEHRNRGYDYWKPFYLSGCREFAKKCTNRCIRSRFRMKVHAMDPEEISIMRHSDYQKDFDYWWTLW